MFDCVLRSIPRFFFWSDHRLAESVGVAGASFAWHGGQGDGECGALGRLGLDLDLALVLLDEFFCHGQAQARSLLAL